MRCFLILVIFLFSSYSYQNDHSERPESQYHPQRLIVSLSASETTIRSSANKFFHDFENENEIVNIKFLNTKYQIQQTLLLEFNTQKPIEEIKNKYEQSGLFQYVEFDYLGYGGGQILSEEDLLPDDPYFNRQWGLKNDGTFNLSTSKIGADIKMTPAWDMTTGNDETIIAILDSGIKLDHPEFDNRIWKNEAESESNSDDDQNGYIDDINGWDFANDDNDPTDDHGHGTNVAGITGATGNNLIGYAGINWNAQILPLKILDDENLGYYSWWISAIYYAVDQGADVINMSVGGLGYSQGMEDAIKYAYQNNVPVIACMMNENGEVPYYPAAYSETIAIGSTDPDDKRSSKFPWNNEKGSNYGEHIDLTAPGNYIYGLSYQDDGNYGTYWSGTSQATPLVTGVASLLKGLNPDLTVEEIRRILRESSDDEVGLKEEDTPGWDKYHGAGRLNAYAALINFNSGTKESIKLHLSIWPNPFLEKDILYIKSDSFIWNITLIDVNGNYLKTYQVNDHSTILKELDFPSGIYFLQISTKTGMVTHRLIKI